MSEENTNSTSTENTNNQTEESVDVLPDWAREKLTKANAEAAKYRTEKNEAVKKAQDALTEEFNRKQEEFENTLSEKDKEVFSARSEVDRLKIALNSGIEPDKVLSFADRLQGETVEELEADAAELAKLFVSSDSGSTPKEKVRDSTQGSGNHTPLNGDPLLAAVKNIVNR